VEEACQSAVTAAAGIDDLRGNDLASLHLIHLELGGMAEMLEDLAFPISDCYLHMDLSFIIYIGIS
jgi:hypothetical protein